MSRIDSITPAQVAKFGDWTKKWVEIGLSTEPADFDKAINAALRAYKLVKLKKPMVILRMSSPYGAVLGGFLAWACLRKFFEKKAWAQVEDQVWAQVGAQVGAQVEAQVGDQVGDAINNDYGGSLWVAFSAYITFIRDVLSWQHPILEKFSIYEDLSLSCGWVWWHENVFSISDRPSEINRDNRGRLHCENGPSIFYRDGWSLFNWHGVNVPDYIIMCPQEITVKKIETESNAEVRRVMIERYGQSRYLLDSGAKEIHKDDWGILYRKEIPNDEPIVMVKVVNSTPELDGTKKVYYLRVPPDMTKARKAIAWTFGMKDEEYWPAVQT